MLNINSISLGNVTWKSNYYVGNITFYLETALFICFHGDVSKLKWHFQLFFSKLIITFPTSTSKLCFQVILSHLNNSGKFLKILFRNISKFSLKWFWNWLYHMIMREDCRCGWPIKVQTFYSRTWLGIWFRLVSRILWIILNHFSILRFQLDVLVINYESFFRPYNYYLWFHLL